MNNAPDQKRKVANKNPLFIWGKPAIISTEKLKLKFSKLNRFIHKITHIISVSLFFSIVEVNLISAWRKRKVIKNPFLWASPAIITFITFLQVTGYDSVNSHWQGNTACTCSVQWGVPQFERRRTTEKR